MGSAGGRFPDSTDFPDISFWPETSDRPSSPNRAHILAVDAETYKAALSRWGSGVSIITTRDDQGRPTGFTATSLTSLSLAPPLVLFCLARSAGVAEAFQGAAAFAAHILSAGQQELSSRFAQSGIDRFAGLSYRAGTDGVPILGGVLAVLECRIVERHEGGDHVIIVGEVQAAQIHEGDPLFHFRGRYAVLSSE